MILTMPEVCGTPINEHSGRVPLQLMHFLPFFQLAKQTSQVIERLKLQWMNGLHTFCAWKVENLHNILDFDIGL